MHTRKQSDYLSELSNESADQVLYTSPVVDVKFGRNAVPDDWVKKIVYILLEILDTKNIS